MEQKTGIDLNLLAQYRGRYSQLTLQEKEKLWEQALASASEEDLKELEERVKRVRPN